MAQTIDITPHVNPEFPLQLISASLGMWEITKENWGEFYVRVKIMELKCGGAFFKDSETGEDVLVTPEMAKEHIGMPVRSKNEERNEWLLRIFGGKARELEYKVEQFDPSVEFPRDDADDEL
ncbi:hypothetical protein ACIOHC_36305 [Streptomyces sp. NPDC088252]|uniref:hypothetical protein n=1 Tax=Streptomyces sp. NPDC088252 TaxID=3365845 RepID=UPI003823839A